MGGGTRKRSFESLARVISVDVKRQTQKWSRHGGWGWEFQVWTPWANASRLWTRRRAKNGAEAREIRVSDFTFFLFFCSFWKAHFRPKSAVHMRLVFVLLSARTPAFGSAPSGGCSISEPPGLGAGSGTWASPFPCSCLLQETPPASSLFLFY